MLSYKGIAFPFKIDGRGGVAASELSYDSINHIKESIEQIILTYPGERVMEPDFGCRLTDFVFENITDAHITAMIKFEIERAITQWEPRVSVQEIIVSTITEGDDVKLLVDIYIYILQYEIITNITLALP